MTNVVLLYTASTVIALWGVAHIAPVRGVVAGFEPLSADNRRVLIMEWVAEGLSLCFIGVLTLSITIAGLRTTEAAVLVYRASAAMLVVGSASIRLQARADSAAGLRAVVQDTQHSPSS